MSDQNLSKKLDHLSVRRRMTPTLTQRYMKRTMQCPICSGDIGLWAIMRAPTPTRIECPTCRSRLQFSGKHWPFILLGTVFGAIIVGPAAIAVFVLCVEPFGIHSSANFAFITFALLVFAFEIPTSRYLMNRRSLEARIQKRSE